MRNRIYCEDQSPIYREIMKSKKNGTTFTPKTPKGIGGIMIGDNMFLNSKTNIIEKIS